RIAAGGKRQTKWRVTSGRDRRRLFRSAIHDGSRGRPQGARHSRSDIQRAISCRSKERAFRQRFGARLQRRPAKRGLQSHQSKRRRALLVRRKFRRLIRLGLIERKIRNREWRIDRLMKTDALQDSLDK